VTTSHVLLTLRCLKIPGGLSLQLPPLLVLLSEILCASLDDLFGRILSRTPYRSKSLRLKANLFQQRIAILTSVLSPL
jgi:hypothetical protein